MNFWSELEAPSGASQPAFKTYRHDAPQLVEGDTAECVGIRVVSFNFGMAQSMLESARQWNKKHIFKFRDVLQSLGHGTGNHFVFCSEVGDARKGFQATNLDFQNIVAEALPGAACSTNGAYLHVWNVREQAAAVVASGTWTAPTGHITDVHWQAFDLTYRDASQLADRDALQLAAPKVGLLVGNMHIPVSSSKAPSQTTRRRIVGDALNHLAGLEVDKWRDRHNFPVMRLLVGDCNLDKNAALAVTQQSHSPTMTALQRDFQLGRWQVCDVHFPDRPPNKKYQTFLFSFFLFFVFPLSFSFFFFVFFFFPFSFFFLLFVSFFVFLFFLLFLLSFVFCFNFVFFFFCSFSLCLFLFLFLFLLFLY